ncbi:MAG: hypothetical protein WKF88_04770 [Ferruginibacter sp.]
MEYSFIKPAVLNILDQALTSGGWASHASSKVSRTVTAQVIITLSKCSKQNLGNTNINNQIEAGINYLINSISHGNREITTFAFSIIAHVEHHKNFPGKHKLKPDFIKKCLDEMIGKENEGSNFYRYRDGQAFSYDRGHAPYFGTYMAMEALLLLLPLVDNAPDLLPGYSKTELKSKIDECFSFLKDYYQTKVHAGNLTFNNENTELFSFGILISYYYQKYRQEYHNLKEDPLFLTESINYFYSNLETGVFKNWSIPISDTPDFHLLYISNLFSGLKKYNEHYSDFFPEDGVKLLYSLGNFICTNSNLHEFQGNNIKFTRVFLKDKAQPQSVVWGTAHSLNAILKMKWGSLKELSVCTINLLPDNKSVSTQIPITQKHATNKTHSLLISGLYPLLCGILSTFLIVTYLLSFFQVWFANVTWQSLAVLITSLFSAFVLFKLPFAVSYIVSKHFPNNKPQLIANIVFALISASLLLLPENKGSKILSILTYLLGSFYYLNSNFHNKHNQQQIHGTITSNP